MKKMYPNIYGDKTYLRELRNFFFRTLGIMDVTFYGAIGDGRTDNYANLQVAIDDAIRRGLKYIYVPFGTYAYRGQLLRTEFITFVGNPGARIINLIDGSVIKVEQFGVYRTPGVRLVEGDYTGNGYDLGTQEIAVEDPQFIKLGFKPTIVIVDATSSEFPDGSGINYPYFGVSISDGIGMSFNSPNPAQSATAQIYFNDTMIHEDGFTAHGDGNYNGFKYHYVALLNITSSDIDVGDSTVTVTIVNPDEENEIYLLLKPIDGETITLREDENHEIKFLAPRESTLSTMYKYAQIHYRDGSMEKLNMNQVYTEDTTIYAKDPNPEVTLTFLNTTPSYAMQVRYKTKDGVEGEITESTSVSIQAPKGAGLNTMYDYIFVDFLDGSPYAVDLTQVFYQDTTLEYHARERLVLTITDSGYKFAGHGAIPFMYVDYKYKNQPASTLKADATATLSIPDNDYLLKMYDYIRIRLEEDPATTHYRSIDLYKKATANTTIEVVDDTAKEYAGTDEVFDVGTNPGASFVSWCNPLHSDWNISGNEEQSTDWTIGGD